jgi:flavin reductase (DIM6/NTAB) family NADH-FMN oxidoreductase RutF
VSLEPPLVLICVGKRTRTAATFAPEQIFSINVLRHDQQALSTYFAGGWKESTPPPHRFVPWSEVPRLEGAALALACRVVTVVDAGDHLVVIGRVDTWHLGVSPREPLLFFDRQYFGLDQRSREAAPELDSPDSSAQLFHEAW